MVVAVAAVLVPATVGQLRVAVGSLVAFADVARDLGVADAADARGGAGEARLDHLIGDAERLEDLPTVVGGDGRDAHLRHDLQDASVDRLLVGDEHLLERALAELALFVQLPQCLEREIWVHC